MTASERHEDLRGWHVKPAEPGRQYPESGATVRQVIPTRTRAEGTIQVEWPSGCLEWFNRDALILVAPPAHTPGTPADVLHDVYPLDAVEDGWRCSCGTSFTFTGPGRVECPKITAPFDDPAEPYSHGIDSRLTLNPPDADGCRELRMPLATAHPTVTTRRGDSAQDVRLTLMPQDVAKLRECLGPLPGWTQPPGAPEDADATERKGRCPDGGYCHGRTFAAGSEPCEPGGCYRVSHAGPLTGTFPGDRWPDAVVALARVAALADEWDQPGAGELGRAAARQLRKAIAGNEPLNIPGPAGSIGEEAK